MFNEIKKEENKEKQGNIITPNLNNDKKVTEGVNDMFSDLDTGDRPSAVKSGKIETKAQSSLVKPESAIVEGLEIAEDKSVIIKKVIILLNNY